MGSSEHRNGRLGAELLKIGDFARLARTNLRTLRYYEELGLLDPAERSTGGFRFYRSEDVNRFRMIGALQRLGLDLARIRELMDTRDPAADRPALMQRVREALDAQRGLIDRRVAELQQQRAGLDRALDKLAECESCARRPTPENNHCHPCAEDGEDLPAELSALF